MKLNIAFPAQGSQKLVEIDDERKLRIFWDKRISQEVDASPLGDEYKGYTFRIMGGQDKDGFPMKQGVLIPGRVRLLLKKGDPCYRGFGARGNRARKSVRGCIVSQDLSVLSVMIVKRGEAELPGLTDRTLPRRLGPKRASKIRSLFNLTKKDDVRKFVIRRELPAKEGKKPTYKAPKIQRLITPLTLQHRRRLKSLRVKQLKNSRQEAADYKVLLQKRQKEAKEKRHAELMKKREARKVAK